VRLKGTSRDTSEDPAVAGRGLTSATMPMLGPPLGACDPAPPELPVAGSDEACSRSRIRGATGVGDAGVWAGDISPMAASLATITPALAFVSDASQTRHDTATHEMRANTARLVRLFRLMVPIITPEAAVSSFRAEKILRNRNASLRPGKGPFPPDVAVTRLTQVRESRLGLGLFWEQTARKSNCDGEGDDESRCSEDLSPREGVF
jgi:hypothetical protein